MADRTETDLQTCGNCGQVGTVSSEWDVGGPIRWVGATGAFLIDADGELRCKCQTSQGR